MDAENIMVEPINLEKLEAFLEKHIGKTENQSFITDSDSIYFHPLKSMLIDNECCAGELEKKFNRTTKKYEWMVSLGIRRETKTETGSSIPMFHEGYIDISESELRSESLLDAKISLKDFMGRRYRYNPRIWGNENEIIRAIIKIQQEYDALVEEHEKSMNND